MDIMPGGGAEAGEGAYNTFHCIVSLSVSGIDTD